ncbi:MAG: hypothetical protein QOF84_5165 [Streptomyces sp.]|nr:hypothetical protein [Streptomyces sp.]
MLPDNFIISGRPDGDIIAMSGTATSATSTTPAAPAAQSPDRAPTR